MYRKVIFTLTILISFCSFANQKTYDEESYKINLSIDGGNLLLDYIDVRAQLYKLAIYKGLFYPLE